jgi:hypothetical protein
VAKYAIHLEVRGVDMFATVMHLVESNPEIRVLKSEMILEEQKARKVITRNQSIDGRMEDRYYKYLLDAHENIFVHEPGSIVEVDHADAAAWCASENYAPTSASALLSAMVRRGYLAKTGTRGIFRLLRPATSNIGS